MGLYVCVHMQLDVSSPKALLSYFNNLELTCSVLWTVAVFALSGPSSAQFGPVDSCS